MYENEIKILETEGSDVSYGEFRAALDTAITLMRAAEPKDEAEEREYCQIIANTIDGRADTMRTIRAQRAAVRAELIDLAKEATALAIQGLVDVGLGQELEIKRLKAELKETT